MRAFCVFLMMTLAVAGCGGRHRAAAPEPVPVSAATPQLAFATYPRFEDTDAWEWDGVGPTSFPVHGIDVSKYQGAIDWNTARRSGVAFAYIKATEGGDHSDEMFMEHWNGAKAAGVRYGAYHFYYFCRPAEEQARWFIQHVPRDDNALPPVLDMEWNHRSKTCKLRPDSATVRSEARKFLSILENHYGKRPIVYTTVDFYGDTGIGRVGGTQFWLRSVAGHPRETYGGARWTFWQYTGTGVVPGVNGPVDINVFGGTPEAWLAWPG